MPKVSICITTYNRGHSLPQTLDSILDQDFTDFELIISDDNSTDNTQAVCEGYVKRDSRVKYFRNEINLKMPGNLNAAISKASGDFIANLHDGDIYRRDIIRKWYDTLSRHPEALFVFNQYQMLNSRGEKTALIDHQLDEVNTGSSIAAYFFETLSSAPWGTVMARREAYRKYGLFDATYGFISDVEMWLRLASKGSVCYVSEPLIELTPRETMHPYFLPHWKIIYLNLLILRRYYLADNAGVAAEKIRKKIKQQLSRSLLILLKHGSYRRAKEILYLIFHSPFYFWKNLFLPFSVLVPSRPDGYDDVSWKDVCSLSQETTTT